MNIGALMNCSSRLNLITLRPQAAVYSDIEFVKDDSSNGGQGSETERKTESEQQIVYAGANT
jgi:hypothetical protein